MSVLFVPFVWGDSWNNKKGEHFIIQYSSQIESDWASEVLREAERYYDIIGRRIGYTRFQDYWTWEDRAKILIYADQKAFMEDTGQPVWSKGGATRHLDGARVIVSYGQDESFLEGVLPHEIGHLILNDFVGVKTHVPLWFDEGVAQLQEEDKKVQADKIMRRVVKLQKHIPLGQLSGMDIRHEEDTNTVAIFYSQGISIIDFLITAYGSQRFGQFCRNLGNGQNFEDALKNAYTSYIDSLSELEEKWLQFMRQ